MKISSLTLYKTRLDANYNNVIDGGRDDSFTNTSLKELVFDAFYSPYVIYNNNNLIKSVKETDGMCAISIAKEYSDIMSNGYNYAIIYDGEKYFYYFIMGMESLNDGDSPSMFISLKRDAWCNNIEYFTNHVEDDFNNVVRSHFPRWYGANGAFYPYYYKSDDGTVFTQLKKESQLYYGGGGNVVWCGVRFSRDTITAGSAGTAIAGILHNVLASATGLTGTYTASQVIDKMQDGTSFIDALKKTIDNATDLGIILNAGGWKTINDGVNFGASVYEAANPLYFFPVAIMTGVSDGVPNYALSFTMSAGGSTASYNFTDSSNIMKIFSFDAEEITDAFLTLCPPINYTVSGSHITVNSAVGLSSTLLRNSSGTKYIFPSAAVEGFAYITQCPVSSTNKTINYSYINDITGFTSESAIGAKLFNPRSTYTDVRMYEPRIYCHPYTTVSVRVGSYIEEVPIIYDRTNIKLVFAMGNKSEPNVSLFLNNMLISAYNNVGTIGKLPTSYDKWKDFALSQLLNMGQAAIGGYSPGHVSTTTRSGSTTVKSDTGHTINSQHLSFNKKNQQNRKTLTTKVIEPRDVVTETSGYTTTSSIPASYNASGLVSGVIQGVGQGLQIMGSATQPNMPSILSNNNIELQIPRIVETSWGDEREMYDLLANLHLYGYTHGECKSVKNNNRVWWDFCRTESCSLPNLTNYNDRYEIENAFNNGVTKWHAELSAFGFDSDFDRNRNNIEREWVNTEDANIHFKFYSNTPLENFGTEGDSCYATFVHGQQIVNEGIIGQTNIISPVGAGYGTGKTMTYQFKVSSFKTDGDFNSYGIRCIGSGITGIGIKPDGSLATYNGQTWGEVIYTPSTPDELVGKTITISSYEQTTSYYETRNRVFIDGVKVRDNYGGLTLRAGTWTIMYNQGVNSGGVMRAFRVYLVDGADNEHLWTEEDAAEHLL